MKHDMFARRAAPVSLIGRVTLAQGGVSVLAGAEYRAVPLILPYGFVGVPPEGVDVALMTVGGVTGCAGVIAPAGDTPPGEVCLRSQGGAEIRLCNDGSIRLNGVTITRDGAVVGAARE